MGGVEGDTLLFSFFEMLEVTSFLSFEGWEKFSSSGFVSGIGHIWYWSVCSLELVSVLYC